MRRRWRAARTSPSKGPRAAARAPRPRCWPTALGAVLTRETGGTAIGPQLRAILHDTAVDRSRRPGRGPARRRRPGPAPRRGRPSGAGRRTPRRQRPQRVLDARLPGLRAGPRPRRARRINDWAVERAVADEGHPARCAASELAARCTAATSTASSSPAPSSTSGRRRVPRDGRRRPAPLDRGRRVGDVETVSAAHQRRRGTRSDRDALPGLASVWDGVVGQPTASPSSGGPPPSRSTPTCSSGRPDPPSSKLPGRSPPPCSPATTTRAAATPGWPCAGEHPDVHEVERVGACDLQGPGRRDRPAGGAGPGRGCAQGADPRTSSTSSGRRRAAPLLKTIEEPPPSTDRSSSSPTSSRRT